ncbi:serine hydrolase domain-containing protein [Parapedobacter tibetensis]|uniref:serine hydrolase domain-containing protein n=1 Tax=Parapedobacter tibetensis TaxID=2972951 RepID=UPI00214DA350|nr:serine hydrolase domain-containing protein [Parapedobacter tibetensis]
MTRNLIAALFVALISQIGFTQDLDKTKLDNYFDALEKNDKFMGSVAISHNGTLIYTRSVGYLDVANSQKANKNTKYRIGSISKTFTATLVLKAVEEKKLSLNQTIETFFPSIKNAEKITISNLLNHRSGIHNITSNKDYPEWNTQPKTEKEIVEIISKSGSDFEPDSTANYSNSNYVLLTYILEKAFEKPYADLLEQYITKPVGLTNTYFGGKIDPNSNEANSYTFKGQWIKEQETDSSIPLGAGAIVSTPTDIIRFGEALFSGKVISIASVERMKTSKDGYGMGLFQNSFQEKKAFGHNGGIDGFKSTWGYFPEEGISFALMSNGSNFNTNDVALAILSAIYDKPYDIPEFSAFEVTSADLDQYLGVYSSMQMPLKITITKNENTLIAQATGQPSFPLEATEKDKFHFDQAGVVLEFDPTEKTMILKQGGGEFTFTKE